VPQSKKKPTAKKATSKSAVSGKPRIARPNAATASAKKPIVSKKTASKKTNVKPKPVATSKKTISTSKSLSPKDSGTREISKIAPAGKNSGQKSTAVKRSAGQATTEKSKESKKINKNQSPKSVDTIDSSPAKNPIAKKSQKAEVSPVVTSSKPVKTKKKDIGLTDSINQGLAKQGQKKRGWRDIEALTERARLRSLLSDIWHEDIDLDSDIFGETDHLSGYYTDKEEVEVEVEKDEEWEEFEEDEG
jgi:hypothetical protein